MNRPNKTQSFVREAIKEAKAAPTGPVTLNIPTNYQAQIIERATWTEVPTAVAEFSLDETIVDMIADAKRPVVWVGNGVVHANASSEVRQLVDTIGAAVITSEAAKGVYPEDAPLCIGNFAATEEVAGLLESSDALISVGVHFRGSET